MSAGLTIEQVLARSLRMPRRRLAAQSAIGRTMDKAEAVAKERIAGTSATAALPANTAAPSSNLVEEDNTTNPAAVHRSSTVTEDQNINVLTSSTPSASPSSSSSSSASQPPSIVSMPSASVSKQAQRYTIPIPKEDPDPYPDRPLLRSASKQGLARNCDDLLTHLIACKQLGDWKDALTVFSAHPSTMTVTHAHIKHLVDTVVDADKGSVLIEMAENGKFANDHQADHVLCYAASALNRRGKWQEALSVLTKMRVSFAPIESYNEIISSREETGEWKEAMSIVFNLKDKHDQYIKEVSEYEQAKARLQEEGDEGTASASSSSSSVVSFATVPPSIEKDPNAPKQLFPKPDAGTWAILITILEKCGQDKLANEVLKVVPPAEREAILASYAALIHMWSHQKRQRW